MFKLETDLRCLCVTPKTGETAYYVYACYTRECPTPKRNPHSPYDLVPYSLPLPTFIDDVLIKPLEPGVFYRLPENACWSLGSPEELSLIPLYVEISHIPYVDIVEDGHGRAYVSSSTTDARSEAIRLSRLCYGSWTVCGLLRTEQAREWAGLSKSQWFAHSLFNKARDGLDPSWQPLRVRGATTLAFASPLLYGTVRLTREEVPRETA